MKKSTVIYAAGVSALGIAAGIWSCWQFFAGFGDTPVARTLVLAALLVLCRCLPLEINDDCTIDMSFISILTIFLLEGPVAAAALYLMTTPLVFIPMPGKQGKFVSIYNTSPIKNAFNISNIIFAILGSGMLYALLGGEPGCTELPGCLLPIFAYVTVSMIINTLLMSVLLHLEFGVGFSKTMLSGFAQFLPNILCAAPIGFFLARLFQMSDGLYLVLLFMLPLLLARYSFKMYVDIKHQQYAMINALSAAIEAKDRYTVGHSKRVEQYSELIAHQLKLSPHRIYTIRIAALFHDIGKIGIEDSILNKPGPLTPEERAVIEEHPTISAKIIEDVDFYGDIKDIILCHHERYDGKGYPGKRNGGEVPMEAAIIAVADAFDAMTSDRPYRKGFTPEKAIGIVREERGKQFDPRPADALIELYEAGMLAPFESGALAPQE